MAYNKKNKVYTIKKAAFISICLLCAVIIVYTCLMLYRKASGGEASDAAGSSNKIQSKTLIIARAKVGMKKGELLDESRIEMVEIPVELAPKGAVTSSSQVRNMRLRQEIEEKEFLNKIDLMPEAAAYEEGDRLIEHNFEEGAIPAAVSGGSTIDIKLFKKGEEDCVVISKIVVVSRSANLLSFYMNSSEQEYIKESATEGKLFAVQYVDDLQKASEVTYIPLYKEYKE